MHRVDPKLQSSIPRLYSRRHGNEYGTLNDDSDLERRFELETKARRKLTVANAEVVPGTSSESDADSHRQISSNRTYGSKVGPVGLGLSLGSSPANFCRLASGQLSTMGDDSRSRPVEKNLRFSLPPSESAGSSYSDELNNNHASVTRPLGLDINHGQRVKSDGQGLANRPFANPHSPHSPISMVQGFSEEETESEREGYSLRRSRPRQRSSSCTPSFQASPKDEDDIYNDPPRSQSVCQRYPEPSRTDRMFPLSLRDLIKNRNSFIKPNTTDDAAQTPLILTPKPCEWDSRRPPTSGRLDRQTRRRSFREQQSEASAIVEDYRSAAARERQAFGIPPSPSDEVLSGGDPNQGDLSHTDSDMSSINESIRQADDDVLGLDADSMLKSLGASERERERRYSVRHIGRVILILLSDEIFSNATMPLHTSVLSHQLKVRHQ